MTALDRYLAACRVEQDACALAAWAVLLPSARLAAQLYAAAKAEREDAEKDLTAFETTGEDVHEEPALERAA